MRVLFAGSAEIAVPSLAAIAHSAHEVVGILTNPEAKVGRGLASQETPVARFAKDFWGEQIPIFSFGSLKREAREAIMAYRPEILVSFAYGRIFGPKFMDIFPRGGINIHPSLLPRWRGSSPIQHAILAQDSETGISIQLIAPEMDYGDLVLVQRIPLGGRETSASLSRLCAEMAAPMTVAALDSIESHDACPTPQSGTPVYCGKISKSDGLIDWALASKVIDARIRAFDPWPGSFTFLRGERLSVLEAEPFDEYVTKSVPGTIIDLVASRGMVVATGQGFLAVKKLQLATRKALAFSEFARGVRDLVGEVLRSQ